MLLNRFPVLTFVCGLVVLNVGSWMNQYVSQPLARDLVVSTAICTIAVIVGYIAYQNWREEEATRPNGK